MSHLNLTTTVVDEHSIRAGGPDPHPTVGDVTGRGSVVLFTGSSVIGGATVARRERPSSTIETECQRVRVRLGSNERSHSGGPADIGRAAGNRGGVAITGVARAYFLGSSVVMPTYGTIGGSTLPVTATSFGATSLAVVTAVFGVVSAAVV